MKLLSLSALATVAAATVPPKFSVAGTTNGGNGCPGNLNVSVAQNGAVLGLDFSNGQFTASAGPTVPVANGYANCHLVFDLLYSAGYQFQIYTTELHGHASLDSGASARVETQYYFSGTTNIVRNLLFHI
jgi:hypothetical protein